MLRLLFIFILSLNLYSCGKTHLTPDVEHVISHGNDSQENIIDQIHDVFFVPDRDESQSLSNLADPNYISLVMQAAMYQVNGDYLNAYILYAKLASSSNNSQVIYNALITGDAINLDHSQNANIKYLMQLFIKNTPNSPLTQIFEIQFALQQQKLNIAENTLDKLILHNTDNANAIFLFMSYWFKNNLQGSDSQFDQLGNYIMHKYAIYQNAHLVSLVLYAMNNNSNLSLKQINIIHNNYPNWNVPIFWLTQILAQHQHYYTLVNVLPVLFTISPTNLTLQNLYVTSLLQLNQSNQAYNYLRTQLNGLNRNYILFELGILSTQNQQYQQALDWFNLIHVDHKSDVNLQQSLSLIKGILYTLCNQPTQAIIEYNLIQDKALLKIVDGLLLNFYIQQKDYGHIDKLLNHMAHNLNDKQTILFKSSFYLSNNQDQQAYNLLQKHFKQYAQDSDFLYQYAFMLSNIKHYQDAISIYTKLLKLHYQQANIYNNLAYVYAQQGTNKYAMQYYVQKAYAAKSHDSNVLDTVGWVYYTLGDYYKSVFYLKLSYDLQYTPTTALHLLTVYKILKQPILADNIVMNTTATQLYQQSILQVLYAMIERLNNQFLGVQQSTHD